MSELRGQQTLFTTGTSSTTTSSTTNTRTSSTSRKSGKLGGSGRRSVGVRHRGRQPQWVGSGSCRACGHGLLVYLSGEGLWAWVAPELVRACPGCGLALSTTTIAAHEPPGTTHEIGPASVTSTSINSLIDRAGSRIDPAAVVWVGPVPFSIDDLVAVVHAAAAAWQSTPAHDRFGSLKDYRVAAVVAAARERYATQHPNLFDEVA